MAGFRSEAISKSKFWKETAIFVVEDDAQNGSDHVDAHRSIALVISPYSQHGRFPIGSHQQKQVLERDGDFRGGRRRPERLGPRGRPSLHRPGDKPLLPTWPVSDRKPSAKASFGKRRRFSWWKTTPRTARTTWTPIAPSPW